MVFMNSICSIKLYILLKASNYTCSMCNRYSVLHPSILAFALSETVHVLADSVIVHLSFRPRKAGYVHNGLIYLCNQHVAMISILEIDFQGTPNLYCSVDTTRGALVTKLEALFVFPGK